MEVISHPLISIPSILEFQKSQELNRKPTPKHKVAQWIRLHTNAQYKTVQEPHPYFDLKPNAENGSELLIAAWYFLGSSALAQTTREHMVKAVRLNQTIMLVGEAGTGKRYAAQLIHKMSTSLSLHKNLKTKPWIELNPFLAEKNQPVSESNFRLLLNLQENEAATIFVNLSQGYTIARLRTICLWMEFQEQQEMSHKAVGSIQWIVILDPATEHTLKQRHLTLWTRLAPLHIQLPTLESRKEDLNQLIDQGLILFAQRFRKSVPTISQDMRQWVHTCSFKGHFAELRLVLERIVLEERQDVNNENAQTQSKKDSNDTASFHQRTKQSQSKEVLKQSFIPQSEQKTKLEPVLKKSYALKKGKKYLTLKQQVQEFERDLVKTMLYECGGNQSQCAKYLGISRRTVYKKINAMDA